MAVTDLHPGGLTLEQDGGDGVIVLRHRFKHPRVGAGRTLFKDGIDPQLRELGL